MPTEENKRKDYQDFIERRQFLDDNNRQKAVAKRRSKNQRTARENITDLCDADSFLEIGGLTVAAQRSRRELEDLIAHTPADGLVCGIGTINRLLFDEASSACCILSYDYTVLAGTQGALNHRKTDRLIEIAKATLRPIIFYVEGGGGRPGDVDYDLITIGGLHIPTFVEFARLSGKVPRIAIVSGYCFAGNASIAGCSDVIIATKNSNMGMGGPAMIEGGGLGVYHPKDIGKAADLYMNGVIDILVEDEAEATDVAKKYLSFFQGAITDWDCEDQAALREVIPENRKFAYDVMKVIHALVDTDSFLELRGGFGRNMVTGLCRIEGKPYGLIANSTRHLGGAVDSIAADKASRFMQLCDAFGLPIISLCDAPGFMVGPETELEGLVRRSSRMYITGASLKVPIITIFLRKAYGLGAMAMCGGSTHEPLLSLAWPSAEFGAMGLEGAVKLGYKKEIETAGTTEEQEALFDKLVDRAYQRGKAIHAASMFEFDEVIDPADTRRWICAAMSKQHIQPNSNRTIDSW